MDIAALYQLYLQHPSVQTDTRLLRPGDLYFALKGPNFNGNAFAEEALEKGAAFAVVDEPEHAQHNHCIIVDDVLETLQDLARYHRRELAIPFLAITGSNGKTTTKELVTAVLARKFRTSATVGNLNNHIGVPLTILRIPADAEFAVIEMGANHQREIASYCTIALPTHGLITNAGKAHLEGFGGEAGVRKGKGELYDYLRETGGAIFRNVDLDYLRDMARDIKAQITYGSHSARYNGRYELSGAYLQVTATSADASATIPTQLVGDYNFPNVMAAVAVGLHFCVPLEEVKEAIAAYRPDNSRSQWLAAGSNHLILDAYNANPTSMKAAIENFAALPLARKQLWLGAMKEMGEASAAEHRALVALVDKYPWDAVLLVGAEFEGMNGTHAWFPDVQAAAQWLKEHLPAEAHILVKGSRGSRMEVLVQQLSAGK